MNKLTMTGAAIALSALCAHAEYESMQGPYYANSRFMLGATNLVSGTLRLGVANQLAYSRYRFQVLKVFGSNAECAQISEFKLLSGEADVTPLRKRVSASSGGTAPGNAVDGDLATQFANADAAAGSTNPAWLELEFESPIMVTHYAFATPDGWCRPYGDGTCRTPTSFQLLGSNDGLTWTVLDERLQYQPTLLGMAWTSPIPLGGADLLANADVKVGESATLDVCSESARVGSLASAVGTVNIGDGKCLSVGFPTVGDAKFFQLVLRHKSAKYRDAPNWYDYGDENDRHSLAMSEFALFDAAGNQVNVGLTQTSMMDAWNLSAGTCCVDASFKALRA